MKELNRGLIRAEYIGKSGIAETEALNAMVAAH